jgi:hypothetical protein
MLTIFLEVITTPWLNALIWIVVAGVIFYLLWWLLNVLALPAPFDKVARAILAVVAVVILIKFLLALLGNPF